ncbi:MAG: C39 family peptidase [Phycisphaerales bacterium]|nr:MAG: C39 family peptidase [Phycisphaerales bacterium]
MIGTLELEILPQPDDMTCGPTCLHAVYRYFGDPLDLQTVIDEVTRLENGGTLAVMLANHALRRGYRSTIYTYNVQFFDPTWFGRSGIDLCAKLEAQVAAKKDEKLRVATDAYLEYLRLGGRIRFEDLTARLIRKHLFAGHPVLTGLSSTYLYHAAREFGPEDDEDDVRGLPAGHFVVLCGYDKEQRTVRVADPLHPNPLGLGTMYSITIERVLCAILLGVLTYDANLLVIEPRARRKRTPLASVDRG